MGCVCYDGLVDPDATYPNPTDDEAYLEAKKVLRQGTRNIETLLKELLQDQSAELIIFNRNQSPNCFGISVANRSIVLPCLDHLSAGQRVLFNYFSTIIRYSDLWDFNKGITLDKTEGIVLIDEVDTHLHVALQHDVLPKLLRLFPKVQFIMTTHAPLFLLGMEKEFGSDGFQIIEMPGGERISAEMFSELKESLNHFKATKEFQERVKKDLSNSLKPLVLTEGATDPEYIRCALRLLGHSEILDSLEIDSIGSKTPNGAMGSGKDALNRLAILLENNPNILSHKTLLLYDCDLNKPPKDIGLLSIRCLPHNEANKLFTKGIENLLGEQVVAKLRDNELRGQFYGTKGKTVGDYGEVKHNEEFRKVSFCRWVCERNDPDDFKEFSPVIEILREFIGAQESSVSQ